jgi:hypothetical protein
MSSVSNDDSAEAVEKTNGLLLPTTLPVNGEVNGEPRKGKIDLLFFYLNETS